MKLGTAILEALMIVVLCALLALPFLAICNFSIAALPSVIAQSNNN